MIKPQWDSHYSHPVYFIYKTTQNAHAIFLTDYVLCCVTFTQFPSCVAFIRFRSGVAVALWLKNRVCDPKAASLIRKAWSVPEQDIETLSANSCHGTVARAAHRWHVFSRPLLPPSVCRQEKYSVSRTAMKNCVLFMYNITLEHNHF